MAHRIRLHRIKIISVLLAFAVILYHALPAAHSGYQMLFVITKAFSTTILVFAIPIMLGWYVRHERGNSRLVAHIAALLYFTLLLLVMADYKLYSLYGFHINGFVLNLITTPGGIESMGAHRHSIGPYPCWWGQQHSRY